MYWYAKFSLWMMHWGVKCLNMAVLYSTLRKRSVKHIPHALYGMEYNNEKVRYAVCGFKKEEKKIRPKFSFSLWDLKHSRLVVTPYKGWFHIPEAQKPDLPCFFSPKMTINEYDKGNFNGRKKKWMETGQIFRNFVFIKIKEKKGITDPG